MIGTSDIPSLPRGVRCHFDRVRQTDVLLGPERVLMLDPIGAAVLTRVDGTSAVSTIVANLAAAYEAPVDVIEGDVIAYLADLVDKRLVDVRHG
ncbi:MAG: pyrroloquinoline quinone biosynthesis peptide chaperone PqqD [Pseudomonadota bacterium]